ncbi:MAG: ribosome maturation factor RimP, partial [Chlorobiales bacterium]|nr:ribosome maturation factor RimP [Chlorobiales bacterium]
MNKSREIIRAWISDIVTKTPLVGNTGEIQASYLVDVDVYNSSGQDIIEVFVDTDQGISIENCRYLSKRISEALETDEKIQQLFRDRYRLDVSSPG